MAQSQTLINNRITEILESIKDISKPNFKQLAREYGVLYQRLLARSKGRPTHPQRPSGTYKLAKAQDQALYDYIARLDELGVCVRLPMIVSCANYLLQQAHDGPGWRDSGLYLLDTKRVKNNIQRDFADWDADSQDTGSNSSDSSSNATTDGTPPPLELNTPLTIRTLKRNIDFCLENEELSENVKRTLFRAYNISVARDQAIGELRTMTSITQSRRSRQQRTRTILKSSMGVIYSHSARKMVQNKLAAELS
ncbi:hypothetical protein GGP41_002278 [Bipolaris sorokiniana]|uniref:HTH CENPB-type domain-containing protein n=1 Tax=Cochliobolus sativus TaxID=45130 RepID=A0A8H5Z687_COCSA|nr:hypothetical protein GGP41_002278 [Bipolaris sorokiniana]